MITLLTRDYGVQSVRAPLKQSKRGGKDLLEPLHSYDCELGLRERDVARLVGCQMSISRDALTLSAARLEAAGTWTRVLRESLWPGAADEELFAVVEGLLDELLHGSDAQAHAIVVRGHARLLFVLGYAFETTRCVVCGRPRSPHRPAHVDGLKGGVVCSSCASAQPVVSAEALAWVTGESEASAAPTDDELYVLAQVLRESLALHARGDSQPPPPVLRSRA